MRPTGILMTVAVVWCCASLPAAAPGAIKGRVVDSEGAVIQGAHLLFHPDASGQATPAARSDVWRETDAAGRFEVQLEPGFYDVCVMATAFTPQCRKVLVTDGATLQHDARLAADALVLQHLGDRFGK